MRNEYRRLKEYMDKSQKTVAVTGAGISYLYGMRRLKNSVCIDCAARQDDYRIWNQGQMRGK